MVSLFSIVSLWLKGSHYWSLTWIWSVIHTVRTQNLQKIRYLAGYLNVHISRLEDFQVHFSKIIGAFLNPKGANKAIRKILLKLYSVFGKLYLIYNNTVKVFCTNIYHCAPVPQQLQFSHSVTALASKK